MYDAAFALVWATDEVHNMNINEAHAYASCNNCAAVAVAYQVVFVIDQDDTNDNVAVPQNLAGALNYDCVNCITYAFARQLFVTLDEDLSPTAKEQLDALWIEIAAYGEQIAEGGPDLDLNLIDERLEEYTHEIMLIVETDQPGTFSPDLFPSLIPTTAPPSTAASTTAAPPPSETSPPPSSSVPESTAATEATTPTASATEEPSPSATATSEPSATNDPTTQAPVTDGTTVNDSTTAGGTSGGSTAGDTTSDGSTSDGSTSGGSDTSP